MRGVLAALGERVRLNTRELTAEIYGASLWGYSDEVSTRRALRRLHAQGRVFCLGFDSYGSRVWCLPENAGILTPPWKTKRDALAPPESVMLGELLASSFAAGMARAWNTQRLELE
ncbi:hypothetical protein E5E91_02720 [Deinococcus radiodurans R1 = ATCC 13939 = DSM 20539]|jgi:hypothetical protein|uniref:Uncharacterized protein n=2 Tax=Deinococcus radiodurans TaxID=1299 RepID=Q9RWY9_DEIRA|nr:hypothetical protein DR_0526 [Deinococcus radiodurans R1 = ATCC 13939 = DSM 20539]ANC72230.1 hypothetical protein A2G07_10885 [Deinococcus radiodurans R1 = ATCC 13939 = DSM 20539]QEM72858.1 hypothetical protein DXG80_12315 [Deinococcus radiodurans]UDL01654.1 hypothetical protein E5E91_02720 [Deinococcus radiodurans R1 = ATCC 13939 = DSM 20539]UID69528.1 hypothetical protein DRO_0523 [Deinococcus radiodurans R1 = ATCC 13939 = DSM 20539]